MKNFFKLLLTMAVFVPSFAFAQTTATSGCLPNPLGVSSVNDILYLAVDIATYIGVVLAVVFLLFAGFKYIAARGNSEKIKEAHNFLLAVVIGIAILIGAGAIVNVIKNTLTSAGVVNSTTFNAPAGTAVTGCGTTNTTTTGSAGDVNNGSANTNQTAPASNNTDLGSPNFVGGGGSSGGGGAGGTW